MSDNTKDVEELNSKLKEFNKQNEAGGIGQVKKSITESFNSVRLNKDQIKSLKKMLKGFILNQNNIAGNKELKESKISEYQNYLYTLNVREKYIEIFEELKKDKQGYVQDNIEKKLKDKLDKVLSDKNKSVEEQEKDCKLIVDVAERVEHNIERIKIKPSIEKYYTDEFRGVVIYKTIDGFKDKNIDINKSVERLGTTLPYCNNEIFEDALKKIRDEAPKYLSSEQYKNLINGLKTTLVENDKTRGEFVGSNGNFIDTLNKLYKQPDITSKLVEDGIEGISANLNNKIKNIEVLRKLRSFNLLKLTEELKNKEENVKEREKQEQMVLQQRKITPDTPGSTKQQYTKESDVEKKIFQEIEKIKRDSNFYSYEMAEQIKKIAKFDDARLSNFCENFQKETDNFLEPEEKKSFINCVANKVKQNKEQDAKLPTENTDLPRELESLRNELNKNIKPIENTVDSVVKEQIDHFNDQKLSLLVEDRNNIPGRSCNALKSTVDYIFNGNGDGYNDFSLNEKKDICDGILDGFFKGLNKNDVLGNVSYEIGNGENILGVEKENLDNIVDLLHAKAKNKESENQLDILRRDKENLQEGLSRIEKDKQDLQEQLESLGKEKEETKQENERLKAELISISKNVNDIENGIKTKNEELKNQLDSNMNKINGLEESIKRLQIELDKQNVELDKQRRTVEERDKEIVKLREEERESKKTIEELQNKELEHQATIDELKKNLLDANVLNKQRAEQLAKAEQQIQSLEHKLEFNEIQNTAVIKDLKTSHEKQVAATEEEKKELKGQIIQLKTENTEKDKQILELEQSFNKKETEFQQTKEENRKLQEKITDISEQNNQYGEQLKRDADDMAILREDYALKVTKIDDQSKQLAASQGTIMELQNQNELQNEAISRLHGEIEEKQEQINKLTTLNKEQTEQFEKTKEQLTATEEKERKLQEQLKQHIEQFAIIEEENRRSKESNAVLTANANIVNAVDAFLKEGQTRDSTKSLMKAISDNIGKCEVNCLKENMEKLQNSEGIKDQLMGEFKNIKPTNKNKQKIISDLIKNFKEAEEKRLSERRERRINQANLEEKFEKAHTNLKNAVKEFLNSYETGKESQVVRNLTKAVSRNVENCGAKQFKEIMEPIKEISGLKVQQYEGLINGLKNCISAVDEKSDERGRIKEKNSVLKEIIENYNEKLNTVKSKEAEERYNAEITTAKESKDAVERERDELNKELKQVEQKNKDLAARSEVYEKDQSLLKDIIGDLTSDLDSANRKNDELEKQNIQRESKIVSLQENLASKLAENTEKDKRILELEQSLKKMGAELQQTIGERQEAKNESSVLSSELSSAKRKIQDDNIKREEDRIKNKKLQGQIEQLQAESAEKDKQNEGLKGENEDLKQKNKQSQAEKTALEKQLRKQVEQQKKQIEQLKEQAKQLKKYAERNKELEKPSQDKNIQSFFEQAFDAENGNETKLKEDSKPIDLKVGEKSFKIELEREELANKFKEYFNDGKDEPIKIASVLMKANELLNDIKNKENITKLNNLYVVAKEIIDNNNNNNLKESIENDTETAEALNSFAHKLYDENKDLYTKCSVSILEKFTVVKEIKDALEKAESQEQIVETKQQIAESQKSQPVTIKQQEKDNVNLQTDNNEHNKQEPAVLNFCASGIEKEENQVLKTLSSGLNNNVDLEKEKIVYYEYILQDGKDLSLSTKLTATELGKSEIDFPIELQIEGKKATLGEVVAYAKEIIGENMKADDVMRMMNLEGQGISDEKLKLAKKAIAEKIELIAKDGKGLKKEDLEKRLSNDKNNVYKEIIERVNEKEEDRQQPTYSPIKKIADKGAQRQP